MNLHAARYIDRWAGVAVHLGLHAVGRAAGRRLPPLGATTPPSAGRTWARPRRVLAIKFYGLGNIVMILPTLAALRTAVPEVEIDFLTLPGNEALLAQSGLVTRVLTVEVATFPRFVRAGVRLIRGLRAGAGLAAAGGGRGSRTRARALAGRRGGAAARRHSPRHRRELQPGRAQALGDRSLRRGGGRARRAPRGARRLHRAGRGGARADRRGQGPHAASHARQLRPPGRRRARRAARRSHPRLDRRHL